MAIQTDRGFTALRILFEEGPGLFTEFYLGELLGIVEWHLSDEPIQIREPCVL